MIHAAVGPGADLAGFRVATRRLIAAGVPPAEVAWSEAASLFAAPPGAEAPALTLPRRLADLIRLVICHRDPERHALLYTAIWRARHGEPQLLDKTTDPLVHRLERMAKAVRRD